VILDFLNRRKRLWLNKAFLESIKKAALKDLPADEHDFFAFKANNISDLM